MQGYWIKFTDGTKGYCEGQSTFDAIQIAEQVSGKKAVYSGSTYYPSIDTLPYPATPIIWQFDHPVYGKCPAFCITPEQCKGHISCPQNHSCTE